MEVNLYNQLGEVVGKTDLPNEIFGLKINHDLLRQAVTAQTANSRQILAHAKDRSEVSGGGKKPWKQKGTGRARHGSIRSPLWRGGGVTFGPAKNRNFSLKINKKMKRAALFMALSGKIGDQQLAVLDKIELEQAKTKKMTEILKNLSAKIGGAGNKGKKQDTMLLILPKNDKKIELSVKNIPFAKTLDSKSLNVLDILAYKFILLPQEAISVIKETYKLN